MIFDILYKTLIGEKLLPVRFDKVHIFIRDYDRTRYLVLFGSEKYGFIYNRIRYFIVVKSSIRYVFCHNYVTIKIDSYDSLPLEGTLTFHNVIIRIGSVWKKDQNHHFYNRFSEKCSYRLSENNDNRL